MKMNSGGWQPTITLAKLFEEQYQFFDALAAYELIEQNESSPETREKIEALQMRIISDPNAKYDPRIEKLFSAEELAYLKILNHSAFVNLSEVAERMKDSDISDEVIFEDEFEMGDPSPDAGKIYDLISEIEHRAQQTIGDEEIRIEDYTVEDFLVSILSKFDKSVRLSEIKFSDIISILLELQKQNPTRS